MGGNRYGRRPKAKLAKIIKLRLIINVPSVESISKISFLLNPS